MSFYSVIVYSHHGVNKVKTSCHYSFRLVDGFQRSSSVAVCWSLHISVQTQGILPGIAAVQG